MEFLTIIDYSEVKNTTVLQRFLKTEAELELKLVRNLFVCAINFNYFH